MHSTRTLATAPTPPRAALARRGRRLPSCSARHRRSRVVVASFGLVLPGDDAFERLRPTRDDDDDDDEATAATTEKTNADARSPERTRRGRELVARWRVTARFGREAAARDALRRWARGIGVEAGVSSERFEVCSGYIGGRESALEMRVGAVSYTHLTLPTN